MLTLGLGGKVKVLKIRVRAVRVGVAFTLMVLFKIRR